MYLYHGTPADFDVPTLNKCKPHRDFGCGFYLATNYFDALPMAVKNSRVGYVQTYLLTDLDGLSVLEFDERSEDWLRFVVFFKARHRSKCRFGNRIYGWRRK